MIKGIGGGAGLLDSTNICYDAWFRKEKEMMKILETPEEKRARRLKKKEDKERRVRAEMGWDEDMEVRDVALRDHPSLPYIYQ